MVMIGRFSSDDPGWCDPSDRESERSQDDADWAGLDPRPRRRGGKGQRCKGAEGKDAARGPKCTPDVDSPTPGF